MLKLKICSLSFLVSFLTSATAAVSVDWESTGGLSEGESAISTEGTAVYAYNLGNATTYTINDVTFKGTGTGGIADLADDGNVLLAPPDNGTKANFSNLAGNFGILMDSATWGFGNAETTITLDNLTRGKSYQVQIFSSDVRASRNNTLVLDSGTENEFSSAGTGSVANGGGDGAYVIGTFIADATGQATFTFRYLATAGNANVNAIQVRQLQDPPKGTVIMIGSVSAWLVLALLFINWRETRFGRSGQFDN